MHWLRHLRVALLLALISTFPSCTGGGGPVATLIGVWCAPFNHPGFGAGTVELILATDAIQFAEQYVYQAGTVIGINGTFRVFTDQNGTATLRLDTIGGPAETYCFTIIDNNNLLLSVAAVECPGGPETCVVNCNACNPPVSPCVFQHQRGSCNAPG